MSQFKAFRERFKISGQIQPIAARPDQDPHASDEDLRWAWSAHHYVATLTVAGAPFRFATCYSQGAAHKDKPTLDHVLYSLAMDCRGADSTFDEWASEIGWDRDSRRAFVTYETIQRTRQGLIRLLGREGYAALLAIDEES